jgi:glucose/mannose-6-phosphate isomerase
VPTKNNPAKQIALALQGKVPVVLGVTGSTDLAALRWKTQINENAKQPAFWSALPELLHNEILAWENGALRRHMCALLLQSPDDAEIDTSRATWMAGRLREEGVPVIEVDAQGGSSLERLLRLVYLGDFVSVYLALCNGVDPTPISGIEEMKRSLGRVESNQPGAAT